MIYIHLMTSGVKIVDLRLNLIDKLSQVLPLLLTAAGRLSDARGIKRDLQSFFFNSSYHAFGDNSDCLQKIVLFQNLTFGDLW